jgi:glycerophosphoryl diester phosphodiesterase
MKLIAHRGASGTFPENTLAAFRGALALGCREIEIDVRQNKSGSLVVLHDGDLKRVAGVEECVGDLTDAELGQLDVGSWFSGSFSGARVPTVAAVLSELPNDCEIHFDIKNATPSYPRHIEKILNAVTGLPRWQERCTFSSEHGSLLEDLRRHAVELRLGYQPRETPLDEALALTERYRVESLRLRYDRLTPEWVERAHERGLEVYVYTVNEEIQLQRLARLGVDRVFSNFPNLQYMKETA